ncbi:alpha/beta hydrolase [Pseudonocardia sp. MH-G8]|nr:alpha/beta fold hydrolase [Pseudonocardia sp. MH-G8]OZM82041.1 alpha/beta hydrolase [Pseudonocardia sp. MH-G8]
MPSGSVVIRSLDGIELSATVLTPDRPVAGVVLVHGGGVTREEGGFFTRLAEALEASGVASLRLDLRGHGTSGGRQEDLTLAGVANDVRAAGEYLASDVRLRTVGVVGASFSGGACAMLAARRPQLVDRLVLFNPLLDYKKRFIDDKDYWSDDRIDGSGAERLVTDGYVAHSPSFRLGRALLNEVFWVDARAELARVEAPTLLVHGTRDTFIPIESSRAASGVHELMEIEGAQHGIAVHDDPGYRDPQTQEWQRAVIDRTARWFTG